ncbi:Tetratricopeptide repeat protein 28 [Stylophora pistillata]|uniref:Tetratricopeptide repeat protein 28 n=1 Tax=Stylophora pistillata TaxID=50429 RepID=A0A2B4R475_STYPI|nr:Tetratricopeptide repeat protein 28 [Stylophora pistillata]
MGVISQRSGALYEAADYSERRIKLLNERRVLQAEDALKATFRNAHQVTYSALRETLIGLSKFDEALCAADQGRAQALLDLMKLRYEFELSASGSVEDGGNRFAPLPFAEEVEMIGKMLGIQPLTGKEATKGEVLERISTVAVVHIAAHGKLETGEIVLAPNPVRKDRKPEEQDFRLIISDVIAAKMRAKLVVLSCCHSAQGKVSSEGVVGVARAFLGAGARSVLVAQTRLQNKRASLYLYVVLSDLFSSMLFFLLFQVTRRRIDDGSQGSERT